MASVLVLPSIVGLAGCDLDKSDGDRDIADGDDADGDDADDDDADDDDADDDAEDPTEPEPEPQPEPQPDPKPDAAQACDGAPWEGTECTTEAGEVGRTYCIVLDGAVFDTPCAVDPGECSPGEGTDYGCGGDICYWDGESFVRYEWWEDDCNTPLVVSFEGGPIEFAPATAASFDLSSDGSCASTDWPTAPWLALDRDGDGAIRSGAELFGNATPMASGTPPTQGFAALAELDSNRDGKISAADARFGELVLWSDLDDDRVGTMAELRPLGETTLLAIDLAFTRQATCDGHGNCGVERAAFEYRTPDGRPAIGEVVDVHLTCR